MGKEKLRDLIVSVRQCRTAAQERELISKESAKIRTALAKEDADNRQRNVAKLLYIQMLGYPTQFGQMECLKLISSQYFADKRIGYLALMLMLDEKQEVLMLVTNSLKTDLTHQNQFVVGLSLCAIANIASTEIARDASSDVARLLGASNHYVRKKAVLAAVRIVRKLPELADHFVPKIRNLLSDPDHGVLIATCTLMLELMEKTPEYIDKFRPYVPGLVRILKATASSGYNAEYDVSGVMDPFLQVKLLRVLRYLGHGSKDASDQMNDILAQIATNTEGERNVGNAILYECVQTIMTIKAETGLRVLAINILGRFLSNRDNNIRYVALNTLNKVLSSDQKAIQRHRTTIVECLKDPDISIRRRALDLVYSLVNNNSVRALVRELLQFLLSSDIEFRSDLAAKICLVTEKFAPNKKWHVDTILRVLSIAGEYVNDDVIASLIALVTQNEDLHSYAVQKMYLALNKDIIKQPLVQACVWCIGEYGDILLSGVSGEGDDSEAVLSVKEEDILNLFGQIDKHASTNIVTREFLLTSVMKLVDRIKSPSFQAKAENFLEHFTTDYHLELHERSCEYYNILKNLDDPQAKSKVIGPVPPFPVKKDVTAAVEAQKAPAPKKEQKAPPQETKKAPPSGASIIGDLDLLSGGPSPTPPAAGGDLMSSIFGGGAPAGGAPAGAATTPGLGDLMSLTVPAPQAPVAAPPPASSIAPAAAAAAPGSFADIVAYNKDGVSINFSFQKNPQNAAQTLINASISTVRPNPCTDVAFQISVPKYIKFQVGNASAKDLMPNGQSKIMIQVRLNNTEHGQRGIMMKLRLEFNYNGQKTVEVADVLNFPPGL